MASTSFEMITKQLDIYKEESWKPLHNEVMDYYKVEDAVALGLSIHERLQRRSEKADLTVQEANIIAGNFQIWIEESSVVLQAIKHFASNGLECDAADRFKQVFFDTLHRMDVFERIYKATRDVLDGNDLSLEEAISGLRSASSPGSPGSDNTNTI